MFINYNNLIIKWQMQCISILLIFKKKKKKNSYNFVYSLRYFLQVHDKRIVLYSSQTRNTRRTCPCCIPRHRPDTRRTGILLIIIIIIYIIVIPIEYSSTYIYLYLYRCISGHVGNDFNLVAPTTTAYTI